MNLVCESRDRRFMPGIENGKSRSSWLVFSESVVGCSSPSAISSSISTSISFSIMSSWSMVLLFLLVEIKKKRYILECPKKWPNIISWYLYAILHIAYNKCREWWESFWSSRFAMFFEAKVRMNLSVTRRLRSFLYEEPSRRYHVCDRWSWMNKFVNTPSCVLEA